MKNSKKKEDCLDHSIDKSDYVITMKIRSDLVLECVADMVREMFENSRLYRYVRYDRPHLTVRNIDTDREMSMGFFDEEPEKDRYLTNKELAMWLAKCNGLAMDKGTGRKSNSYDYWENDKNVDYINIAVRKWEDEEWHKPTYGYCFGDKRK